MKLVILQDDFPPHHEGGSAIIAAQLADRFAEQGHQVIIVTTVRNKRDAGEEYRGNIKIIKLSCDYDVRFRSYVSLYNPLVVSKVKRILKETRPDIVHVHNVHHYLSYYSIVLAKRFSHRVFMTAHDSMTVYFGKPPFTTSRSTSVVENPNLFRESLWRQLRIHKLRYNPIRTSIARFVVNRFTDRVIAVSEALKNVLIANGLIRVSVIHNGIDASVWNEPEGVRAFKRDKGIGDTAILFGGRLSEAKGALKMLDALKHVQERIPGVQLLIIGKKEEARTRHILDRARSSHLEQSLVFTGWLDGDELRKAYYSTAIVAVPSLYLDPFPTINLEACACGKPVVATCFGGSPEIIKDGFNGYVINPNDDTLFAERILNLLNDVELRRRYGEQGRECVLQEFSIDRQFQSYRALFEDSL